MAERIQVELVDDIDGSPAQQTVTFALDGVTYEIDLSEQHARRLRTLLARYIERATVPGKEREQERASPSKRQEREERATRQANRALTEEIRGAAQRTKDRLSKQQDAEPEAAQPEAAEPETEVAESPAASRLQRDERGQRTEDQQDDGQTAAVPAVSLPQFSSAVD